MFYRVEVRTLCGQSSSSTPNSLIHVFMDLALCTGAQSCWNRKEPSPNCSHKVGSIELSNISWYAEAFSVLFTGTKGPSPAPEKQPHTIIPPPPTLHLAQCSQTNTVLLATAKPRLVHQMLCIALTDVWLGCSCSVMEAHSVRLPMHCSWATWSLEVCSDWLCRKLVTSVLLFSVTSTLL